MVRVTPTDSANGSELVRRAEAAKVEWLGIEGTSGGELRGWNVQYGCIVKIDGGWEERNYKDVKFNFS